MKPERGRDQAATQVKGLSPEKQLIREADVVHSNGRPQDIETDRGKVSILLAGSETAAWDREDDLGTWETQSGDRLYGLRSNKL